MTSDARRRPGRTVRNSFLGVCVSGRAVRVCGAARRRSPPTRLTPSVVLRCHSSGPSRKSYRRMPAPARVEAKDEKEVRVARPLNSHFWGGSFFWPAGLSLRCSQRNSHFLRGVPSAHIKPPDRRAARVLTIFCRTTDTRTRARFAAPGRAGSLQPTVAEEGVRRGGLRQADRAEHGARVGQQERAGAGHDSRGRGRG